MANFETLDITIPAGQALSNSVDCTAGKATGEVVALVMPADWNYSGGLTFQLSTDNVEWFDSYQADGIERMMAVKPGGVFALGGEFARMAKYVRLRAGTKDHPVPQAADRVFKLVVTS
jgi:hypothetical protein